MSSDEWKVWHEECRSEWQRSHESQREEWKAWHLSEVRAWERMVITAVCVGFAAGFLVAATIVVISSGGYP